MASFSGYLYIRPIFRRVLGCPCNLVSQCGGPAEPGALLFLEGISDISNYIGV